MTALSHHRSQQQKDPQSRISLHRCLRDHAHSGPGDFTGHCIAFVLPQKFFPLRYFAKTSISATSPQQQGLHCRQGWLDPKQAGTCFAQSEPITDPWSAPWRDVHGLQCHLPPHALSPHSESKCKPHPVSKWGVSLQCKLRRVFDCPEGWRECRKAQVRLRGRSGRSADPQDLRRAPCPHGHTLHGPAALTAVDVRSPGAGALAFQNLPWWDGDLSPRQGGRGPCATLHDSRAPARGQSPPCRARRAPDADSTSAPGPAQPSPGRTSRGRRCSERGLRDATDYCVQ